MSGGVVIKTQTASCSKPTDIALRFLQKEKKRRSVGSRSVSLGRKRIIRNKLYSNNEPVMTPVRSDEISRDNERRVVMNPR